MEMEVKARAAKELLDSEVIKGLFEDLEKQAYADIKATAPDEIEKRESIYFELLAIGRIHDKLRSYVDNQKVAEYRKR